MNSTNTWIQHGGVMIINNLFMLVMALLFSLAVYIIYTKVWMIIANHIGEKLGIKKMITKLLSKSERDM